jgi:hypothetical protein
VPSPSPAPTPTFADDSTYPEEALRENPRDGGNVLVILEEATDDSPRRGQPLYGSMGDAEVVRADNEVASVVAINPFARQVSVESEVPSSGCSPRHNLADLRLGTPSPLSPRETDSEVGSPRSPNIPGRHSSWSTRHDPSAPLPPEAVDKSWQMLVDLAEQEAPVPEEGSHGGEPSRSSRLSFGPRTKVGSGHSDVRQRGSRSSGNTGQGILHVSPAANRKASLRRQVEA